jgi:3-dehydroquinate dehydratase II
MAHTVGPQIWIIQGPNLNMLGHRDPALYGVDTLDQLHADLSQLAEQHGVQAVCRQSNHEGQLIDWLHEARQKANGVIFNPGGYSHTSVALRDAVELVPCPIIEVHLSNIAAREPFRQHSLISPVASGVITGLGGAGYKLALLLLATTQTNANN